VDVSQRSEHLVSVDLNEQFRHALFHLHIVSHDSIDSLWNIIHDYVKIHLVSLIISSCVKGMFHRNNVGMKQFLHDLKFSILVPLILIDFLDGNSLSSFGHPGLINYSERPVSNDPLCIVSQ